MRAERFRGDLLSALVIASLITLKGQREVARGGNRRVAVRETIKRFLADELAVPTLTTTTFALSFPLAVIDRLFFTTRGSNLRKV